MNRCLIIVATLAGSAAIVGLVVRWRDWRTSRSRDQQLNAVSPDDDSNAQQEQTTAGVSRESNLESAPIRQQRTNDESHNRFKFWGLIVSMATLLAVIFYACVAYEQREEMGETNRLSRESGEVAQRAWVAPLSGIGAKLFYFPHDQNAALYLRNSGKTTASNVTVFAESRVFRKMPEPGMLKYRAGTLRGVIAPDQVIVVPVQVQQWAGIGEQKAGGEESDIWTSKRFFVVWGRITYVDSFYDRARSNERWTNFCLYFDPHIYERQSVFVTCPHSNDAR